ncbi:transposase [Prescottella agglutinans]|uniref:transposase n=1 Tax=Prescottella agglutinans TaxID=1644129 RepID=UPI003CC8D4FB
MSVERARAPRRDPRGAAARCRCRCRAEVRSKDAFARHNGTAPLPVWSSNRSRHRLSRTGNLQLNAAIHRIALAQARCHEPARALLVETNSRRRRRHGSSPHTQTQTL